jgi:hypothetical protein
VIQAAIRDPDPVCVLENELLYGVSFPVDKKVLDTDFMVPIGKAKVQQVGTDVTLVAFSKMVCHLRMFLDHSLTLHAQHSELALVSDHREPDLGSFSDLCTIPQDDGAKLPVAPLHEQAHAPAMPCLWLWTSFQF